MAPRRTRELPVAAVRLLGCFALRFRGSLHGFRLFLIGLVQHLLLVLDRLAGLARIFLGADALSLGRDCRCHTQNGQQHESSDSFHNVSERTVLEAILHRSGGRLAHLVLLL